MKSDIDKIKPKYENKGMFLAEGDRWLLEQGVITDITHNNIILNLYMNTPRAKYIEYFLDMDNKIIEVHFKFGWFWFAFQSEKNLLEDTKELLGNYLKAFEVKVVKEKV